MLLTQTLYPTSLFLQTPVCDVRLRASKRNVSVRNQPRNETTAFPSARIDTAHSHVTPVLLVRPGIGVNI